MEIKNSRFKMSWYRIEDC